MILGVSAFAGLVLAISGLAPAFRAAKVDPMDALRRAQGLQDPSAKAIGMIAVARVVLSKNLDEM